MAAFCRLAIKVVPGASRSAIVGWLGDELKLRVAAPPEKGKANLCVLKLLAKTLGLSVKALSIVHGQTSAHKIIEIQGLTRHDLEQRFGKPVSR